MRDRPQNKQAAVVALRLIAAQAHKLADDLEAGRLWDGDYAHGLKTIDKALEDTRPRSG